jgi:hypothetical protein
MNCKNCNTPVSSSARSCPNCGRQVTGSLGGSGLHEQKSPAAAKLSPSSAMDVEEELPLQDEVSEDSGSPETTGRGNTGSYSKVRTASGKPKPDTTARPKPPARPASPPSLPSPGEVGAMLIEQPHLLEPGLSVEQDGSGKSVGARMSTDVGQIDLLARDDAGGLVVVMVPAPDEAKDVVGDVLRRIGWVRKHRAKKGQDVRGVVIMAEVPDEVAYAATAVSDTVSFKTFRLSVAFDEVDL